MIFNPNRVTIRSIHTSLIIIDWLGLGGRSPPLTSMGTAINPFIPQQESGLVWTTVFDRTISLANQSNIYVTQLPISDVSNLGKLYRIRLESTTAIGDPHENGIYLMSMASSSSFYYDNDFRMASFIGSGDGSGYPANTVLYDDIFMTVADTGRYGASGKAESFRMMYSIMGNHTSSYSNETHPYLWLSNGRSTSDNLPWSSGSVRLRIYRFG